MLDANAIIHVTTATVWDPQAPTGNYVPPGFDREGFIHCCHPRQLQRVLRAYFANENAVLLLVLDEDAVEAEIKVELAPSVGEEYPHIYGPLNVSAVVDKLTLTRDGEWTVPADL